MGGGCGAKTRTATPDGPSSIEVGQMKLIYISTYSIGLFSYLAQSFRGTTRVSLRMLNLTFCSVNLGWRWVQIIAPNKHFFFVNIRNSLAIGGASVTIWSHHTNSVRLVSDVLLLLTTRGAEWWFNWIGTNAGSHEPATSSSQCEWLGKRPDGPSLWVVYTFSLTSSPGLASSATTLSIPLPHLCFALSLLLHFPALTSLSMGTQTLLRNSTASPVWIIMSVFKYITNAA